MQRNVSPIITPEYYPRLPSTKYSDVNTVKALFLSYRDDVSPQIITDKSDIILSTIFKNSKPIPLFFNKHFHIYVNPIDQVVGTDVNFVATFLARMNSLSCYNNAAGEQVCGNVIIFGSKNLLTNIIDNKNHSVPFPIVEECLRIYDIR